MLAALKLYLVIHIDPICIIEGEVKEAYEEILSLIKQYKYIESVHDFRVVGEGEVKNLIFDIVVDPSKKFPVTDAELMDKICINI